jgi:hypothetical protein
MPSHVASKLQHLDLSGQSALSEEALQELLQHCNSSLLHYLALADTQAAAAVFSMLSSSSSSSSRGSGAAAAAAGRAGQVSGLRFPEAAARGLHSSSSRLRQQLRSKGFPQLRMLDVCGCAALQGSDAAAAAFRAFRDALPGLPQLRGAQTLMAG